jgi:uncharacterized protein
MRFVADVMLGRLARWLRILGNDTCYNPAWDDAHIIRIARAESRILLTRDRELARRSVASLTLIKSEQLDEQLGQLQHEFRINCKSEPRCPICNSQLQPITKEEAWDQVPLYAFIDNQTFSRCLGCGRFYWPGSQWRRIRATLETIIS